MRLDLLATADKLTLLKDNWPSFAQTDCIDTLSKSELQCTLCLLNVIIEALADEEIDCPNREIIRLVIIRMYVQNRFNLFECMEEKLELEQTEIDSLVEL